MAKRTRRLRQRPTAQAVDDFAPEELAIVERIRAVFAGRTVSESALLLGLHNEPVRRVLRGLHRPPARFLVRVCEHMNVNAEWLLLGRGPMTGGARRKNGSRATGRSRTR